MYLIVPGYRLVERGPAVGTRWTAAVTIGGVDAGRIGPPMPPGLARLLDGLRPDELGLRDRIAPELDASMIDEMAAADYGVDIDQHGQALRDLLTTRYWPDRLDNHPLDVVELVRGIRPEHPSPATGATGRRGHLMRIFACLALIRTRTRDARPADSLAALVESALELGPPIIDDALRYLVWCRRHEPGDWPASPADRPFLTFGVLLLASRTRAEAHQLGGLAHLLLDEQEAVLIDEGLWWRTDVGPPLIVLSPHASQRRRWRDLAGRCLVDGAPDHHVGRRLVLLGEAIRGTTDSSTSDIRPLFAGWDA